MPRIGDTVRPELLRSDTSGILRGSAAGAASLGQGLAGGMQSLAGGIRAGKEAKGEIAGGRKFAKAMLDMHGEDSDIGKQMLPLIEFFDNPEARQSEKLGAVKYMTPIVGALTQKQAQDIAELERDSLQAARNMDAAYRGAEHILNERKTAVSEDLAATAKLEAHAKMLGAAGKQTVAEEATEREQAKLMAPWFAGGDKKAQLHVDDLENVLNMFGDPNVPNHEDRAEKSGGMIKTGKMEGLAQNRIVGAVFAGEKAKQTRAAKERVYKAIIGTLRETLGAQFTENEAKRILGLYWDDLTTEDINYSKVQELKVYLQTQIDAKRKQAKSFRETGSFNPGRGGTEEGTEEGTGAEGTGAGGATSRLGGFRARSGGGGTGPATGPATASLTGPEAAEFTTLLRDSKFTAKDLAKFRNGTDAEMGALLNNLRWRGRAAQDSGGDLSAEDKETLMEQFVNPPLVKPPAIESQLGPDPLEPLPHALPLHPIEDEDHNVDLRVSRTVPFIRPPNRIPEWFEGGTDQGTGQADLYKRRKDRPGVPGTYEEFLQLPDAEKVSLRDDYIASAPRAEIVDGTPGKIPREIKSSSTLLGSRLPKTTMASTRELTYAPEAKLRVSPEFSPGLAERKSLRKRGILMANLDANHSGNKKGTKTPVKRVIEPVMIIPDGATKDTRTRAQSAVRLMDDLYSRVHGRRPKRKVNSRVKTTTENRGRGREHIMHTELFAVTDNKMVNYLKTDEGAREYTGILHRVFGDLDGMRWFLPHSEKRQGATTDKGSSEVDLALHFMKYL